MKELDYLQIINKELENNSLLGDDCAFLEDLNIFITQDTLYENVHFSLDTISPYLLGRKSVNVNLSDLAAAFAKPLYITVSLSLPKNTKDSFIKDLYKGINDTCKEYNIKVAGGDITGGDNVVISICAIGQKISPYTTSRKYAKKGDYIFVTGCFGSSSAGLYGLSNFLYTPMELKDAHLNPKAKIKEGLSVSSVINKNIAAMDTSDGLIDAVYKISQASKHSIEIDINKVPINSELIKFCDYNKLNFKDFVKWGGEDYELLICVDEETAQKTDKNIFTCIGKVLNKDTSPTVIVKDNLKTEKITKEIFEQNSFNHF